MDTKKESWAAAQNKVPGIQHIRKEVKYVYTIQRYCWCCQYLRHVAPTWYWRGVLLYIPGTSISSAIFLLSCLASYLSSILLPYPGRFLFVLFRLCSSRLLLSSKYVFLCRSYFASSRNFFGFTWKFSSIFRSSYFLDGVFVVLSYPGTFAFDLP